MIPPEVQEAGELTVYAAETRYPGIYAPVIQSECDEAVRIAQNVVEWAEALIS
jgi:HEPN domain-containing protein